MFIFFQKCINKPQCLFNLDNNKYISADFLIPYLYLNKILIPFDKINLYLYWKIYNSKEVIIKPRMLNQDEVLLKSDQKGFEYLMCRLKQNL